MRTPVPDYLTELIEGCTADADGELASYIPELANVDPAQLAVAVCTPDGTVYAAGDADAQFTIQSISKPFAYALALRDRGLDVVLDHVGVEPSGDAFNEMSVESATGRPRNPMINIGAITTHSLVGNPAIPYEARAAVLIDGLSRFAGRTLDVDEAVLESEYATRYRNVALASMARSNDFIHVEPDEAVWGYTKQCSALVTARDLAVMATTLAGGGKNPLTGEQVVPQWVCRQVLSVMMSCGMYDAAGDWLSQVGIPAKSGVSGGILGALPGQAGIGTFSPRLDRFGNSVRGVQLFERLSGDMGLHIMELPAPSIDAIGARDESEDGRPLIAVQGPVIFSTAELALRRFAEIPDDERDVVIDLRMVTTMNSVGKRMLAEGVRRLKLDGREVELLLPRADFSLT
ncbi:MAG TPA: glutaminase [Candidatus Agrococcus pullicola]|uniref:Glutaminase n=1 Tax=Candidatus Agrococcus pullicola TaxID=2838429 RepID=A0A9D1YSX5_9MICO|nr:glutaminase [Candidatus Agrococcus pullicola]